MPRGVQRYALTGVRVDQREDAENRLVGREIGDQLLELAILLAQLAELLQFAGADAPSCFFQP
jgi:hypothetical protein